MSSQKCSVIINKFFCDLISGLNKVGGANGGRMIRNEKIVEAVPNSIALGLVHRFWKAGKSVPPVE
ncbi:MAG TPA: hypothetical protein VMU30_10495 [Bacteroidota bacterium]|nr:hypothetical protein [Bacteroidota bacterium]